jgi:hypothetical protein
LHSADGEHLSPDEPCLIAPQQASAGDRGELGRGSSCVCA